MSKITVHNNSKLDICFDTKGNNDVKDKVILHPMGKWRGGLPAETISKLKATKNVLVKH